MTLLTATTVNNAHPTHLTTTMEDAVNATISEPLDIVKLSLGE